MRRSAAIAVLALLAFGCRHQASNDFSHVVRVDRSVESGGDTITIQQVRGPSDRWIAGGTYEVTGTYQLTSREKALLGAFVTAPPPNSGVASGDQLKQVAKGHGQYTLRFRLPQTLGGCPIGTACGPHLGLYPLPGGQAFVSAYI